MNTMVIPELAGELKDTHGIAGKSILITGGGSELGAALSRTLAAAGARIMIGDLNADAARAVADAIACEDGSVQSMEFDVGNPKSAEYAIASTIEVFGRVDVLINNAGTDITMPLEEMAHDQWDRVMHTNLYGPFLLSKAVVPRMKVQGGGHIINIAATTSVRGWPNASAYHASKWGLLGFSHALQAELRPHNIRVTAVVAGGMGTPSLVDRFPDIDATALQDPVDIARAVKGLLMLPDETVVPEITVMPMREVSRL
ncbi:MAG: family oxidoreductase [Paucimonas sp.]|nr:family oxidoreductase [Paucimonas sp.]